MRRLHLRFVLDAIDTLDYTAQLHGATSTAAATNGIRWALVLAGASGELADRHAPLIAAAMAADTAPYLAVAKGDVSLAQVATAAGKSAHKKAAYAALFVDLDAAGVA